MSTGKRKYDEIASSGYYLPQRDGAGDVELCSSASEVNDDKVSVSPYLNLFLFNRQSYSKHGGFEQKLLGLNFGCVHNEFLCMDFKIILFCRRAGCSSSWGLDDIACQF